jgi:hypothetical protein
VKKTCETKVKSESLKTDSETFSIKRAFSGYVLKIDYVLEFAYVLK